MNPEKTFDLGSRSRVRRVSMLASVSASVFLVGCGGEAWHAETYPASGKVVINGDPAADAVVELHSIGEQPDSRNSRPWGIVQSDGSYRLTTYETADGAPPGEYAVTLRWPSDISTPSHFDRLAGAFSAVDRAPLKVTIKPEENVIPSIDLTKVKVLPVEARPRARKVTHGPGPRRHRPR